MGIKGDKHTSEAELSVRLFTEKLSETEGITSKKMFGGYGVFHEGKMFGIVDSGGRIYLKTNEETAPEYIANGSVPHGKMPYHSVSADVLNSHEKLKSLVMRSIEVSK